MNKSLSVKEYVELKKNTLDNMYKHWIEENRIDPEIFDDEPMTKEEWDEQLRDFEDIVKEYGIYINKARIIGLRGPKLLTQGE